MRMNKCKIVFAGTLVVMVLVLLISKLNHQIHLAQEHKAIENYGGLITFSCLASYLFKLKYFNPSYIIFSTSKDISLGDSFIPFKSQEFKIPMHPEEL